MEKQEDSADVSAPEQAQAQEQIQAQTRAQEQVPKKGKGPIVCCEIYFQNKLVWEKTCHWAEARKQARKTKATAEDPSSVVLLEGGEVVPPEKWDKTLALPVLKKNSAKKRKPEKMADKEPEMAVPIRLGKYYRKFILESIIPGDEISSDQKTSGRFFFQEIPEEEMRALLKKGAGLE